MPPGVERERSGVESGASRSEGPFEAPPTAGLPAQLQLGSGWGEPTHVLAASPMSVGWSARGAVVAAGAAMSTRDLSLEDALELVGALTDTSLRWSEATKEKLRGEFERLVRGSLLRGASRLSDLSDRRYALAFVHEPVAEADGWREASRSRRKTRRWAVGLWCAALQDLGFSVVMPRIELAVETADQCPARPLTDSEMGRVLTHARRRLFHDRGPAAVALAQASGTDAEIALVRISHADLDGGAVTLGDPDSRSHRVRPLTPWGAHVLAERIEEIGANGDRPIVVNPGTEGASASASVSGELRQILGEAGLSLDPSVMPKSIRAWAGLQVWNETGNPIAVAHALGVGLQRAMDAICVDWRAR
jgi:hypothetical protein